MSLFKSVVILTGAGVSAESGIKTFRDSNGLWENHRIEDVATPEAFHRNPKLVHEFYNLRRKQLKDPQLKPNHAHYALAELEKAWKGDFLLVTQNVDNLHERAGSQLLLHMHGELQKVFCLHCEHKQIWLDDLTLEVTCPGCGKTGGLRPDIVWFGEVPYHMDLISSAVHKCDLFIAIGTSGAVYPAAGFARQAGNAKRIEVNLQKTEISEYFDQTLIGPAGQEIPKLVSIILGTDQ